MTTGSSGKIDTRGSSIVSEIDLGTICEGDEVRLRDKSGNIVVVNAHVDHLRQELYCLAFGTRLYFARKTAAGWQRMSSITVVAHQPSLFSA